MKKPYKGYWVKLKLVFKYIKITRELKLILSSSGMAVVKWWVHASYGVYEYCRGHTGSMVSLVKLMVSSFSNKKINVKISINDDLIDVYDSIAKILCSIYFIYEQGYNFAHTKLMQKNKSAILLENNDKFSCSKRTKHIKTSSVFVTDRVAQCGL